MNAPDIRPPSERAEARRLVDFLQTLAAALKGWKGAGMKDVRSDINAAAALLDSYQAGIAIATPHPLTGILLVERIAVEDGLPPEEEIVLIWLAEDADDRRPWLGHIDADRRWWFVDASVARGVTHWAHRPRAAQ